MNWKNTLGAPLAGAGVLAIAMTIAHRIVIGETVWLLVAFGAVLHCARELGSMVQDPRVSRRATSLSAGYCSEGRGAGFRSRSHSRVVWA